MSRPLQKTITYLFLLTAFIFFSDCKRHRKVHVDGIVTDTYTGQAIPNLKIRLYSSIKTVDKYTHDYREYYSYTDADGKYNFNDAFFSKPDFYGEVQISDENGIYSGWDSEAITKKDAKLIGKSKVTRNLEALCYTKLNLSINVSNSYNWYSMKISQKFIGTHYIDAFSDFGQPTYFFYFENNKQNLALGYTDGKTILKTELFSGQEVLLKTKYDTLVSNGCGTATNFTVVVN